MNKKNKFSSLIFGLVFASLFSALFYVMAVTTHYLPLKLPATLPFLVADQTSTLPPDGGLTDEGVVDSTVVEGDLDPGSAYTDKLVELDHQVREAGIPINGISLLDHKTRETEIDFKAEATEEQKSRAHEMVNHFDWTITYKDIFNPQKAKEEIIKQYPPEKLAMVSAHLPVINYFLDHKEFKKLKAFLNSLFLQNTISQDDYMVFANILAGQKIYLNPVFAEAPAENPPAAPAAEPPAQTPAPEPSVEDPVQPQPQAEPAPAEQTPVVEQPPADEPLPAPPAAEPPAESPQN